MLERLKALIFGGPPPGMPAPRPAQPEQDSPAPESRRRRRSRPREEDGEGEMDEEQRNRLAHDMPGEFERVFGHDEADPQSWIGVDLDGTLSEMSDEVDLHTIGAPIPEMVARVNDWIAHGYQVKILTARACVPEGIPPIKAWLKEHALPDLEITDAKDLHMLELWDDRGVQVIANTGQPVGPSIFDEKPEGESEKD